MYICRKKELFYYLTVSFGLNIEKKNTYIFVHLWPRKNLFRLNSTEKHFIHLACLLFGSVWEKWKLNAFPQCVKWYKVETGNPDDDYKLLYGLMKVARQNTSIRQSNFFRMRNKKGFQNETFISFFEFFFRKRISNKQWIMTISYFWDRFSGSKEAKAITLCCRLEKTA